MKKNALIFGVANERSLAWGIAQSLHEKGYELGFTYLGEALERRVRPLAESVGSKLIVPFDVRNESELKNVFQEAKKLWGGLDGLVHSLAFANREDLEGRFVETGKDGFLMAMEVSAYSLVALAREAEPLMVERGGGAIVTLSYYGAEKVIPHYNVMGVAKAALEACVRYLASDLGGKKIRVNAISAGPVKTLAAAGIRDFRTMLSASEERAPLKENIEAKDVGETAAFLIGDGGKHITGATIHVDSGLHVMG